MFDLSKLKDPKAFVELLLEGVTVISKLIGGATEEIAAGVVAGVKSVLDALTGAYEGRITEADALAAIRALHEAIVANDIAADSALTAKFGTPSIDPPATAEGGVVPNAIEPDKKE